MFGMSMFFFEVQRSGRLPADTRAPWRGDSFNAGGDWFGGVDGGYFDAGDHCIFQLPHAYSIARIAWATHAYWEALATSYFDGASNYDWAYAAVQWGADFLAENTEEDRVLLHVGDIDKDHAYIGRSELYPRMDRNVRYCAYAECSDVAGEMAAALAHAAIVFKNDDARREMYWSKAKLAYKLTGVGPDTFGSSNDAYDKLAVFYTSSGVVSHVLFGAASMYAACLAIECGDEAAYLADVMRLGAMKESDGGQKWFWQVPSWDHAWWDSAALMLSHGVKGPDIYGEPAFSKLMGDFATTWVDASEPVQMSPEGQRWVSAWGSNRFALNGAAMLLLWADLPDDVRTGSTTPQAARCAAVKQIHYVAGDNDRGTSYVVGFGNDPPVRNHHRNSVCTPSEQDPNPAIGCSKVFVDVFDPQGKCPIYEDEGAGVCYVSANRPNAFQAHGALVGGAKTPTDAGDVDRKPYSDQGWNDWRTDYVGNEQATDYNALFSVALAAAINLPAEFWSEGCGTGADAFPPQNGRGGNDRVAETFSDDEVWTFADFEKYGWTRTKN
jgi:endoglucanase